MLIKKATVQWDGSKASSELRILFYDQDGNLFESGKTMSNNASGGETENFKVTHTGGTPYTAAYYPIYAVSTTSYKDIGSNSGYCYFKTDPSTKGLFTIEFKTIKPISKIKICTFFDSSAKRSFYLDIYDIYGNTKQYSGYDSSTTIHTYDLQVDVYNVNEVGTTETTISSNIQEIQTAKSLNVDYDMPDDTEIRIALSNDDRNTYKIFDGSNWIVISKNDIASSGMLPSFVNSLTENDLQPF